MNTFPTLSTLALPARDLHSLAGTEGLQLTCQEGCLWVTLDHDPRDIVLEAGQSFTLTDQRRVVVYALEASRLTVRTLPVPDFIMAGGRNSPHPLPGVPWRHGAA